MARLERIPVVRSRWLIVGFSALLILLSAALLFIKGFNLGIDFESGLSQRVQVAPSGLKVSFEGSQGAKLSVSDGHLVLEIRDSGGVKASTFALEGSVADLAKAMEAVDGIDVTVIDPSLDASLLITGFGFPATLTQSPFVLNFAASDGSLVTIDLVRKALSDLRNVKVQSVGEAIDQVYQIRIGLEDGADSQALERQVSGMLDAAFGPDEVVTLESSYIGAKFSASLITSSLKAVGIAVALILVYVWLRFELAYAIGSVLALVHDVICMLGLVLLCGFELSSTTIAALLTIIGYSLNNSIVIFDRVRENIKANRLIEVSEHVDRAVAQSLARTTWSSVTTLLAILPLCILAGGDIQLFALEMSFGILIGTYSSNFIAPNILFWLAKNPKLDPRKEKKSRSLDDEDVARDLMGDTRKAFDVSNDHFSKYRQKREGK